MKTTLHAAGIALLAAACVAACGGNDNAQSSVDPNGPTTFRAYSLSGQAFAPAAAGAASTPLTAAEVTEVAQRSRDWAVSVLAGPGSDLIANALTVPPLYFALTHTVASAARGETLAALRLQVAQTSSATVQAGLMHGVARRIGAPPEAVFSGEFMNAVSMAGRPGTWQSLELEAWSAAAVAADSNLRLSVYDQISRYWPWAQVQAFSGTFAGRGMLLKVPMLRVSGPVLRHTAATYSAVGMPLPDSTWLIQITPDTALADWPASSLSGALADVATAIAARPVSAAAIGDMVLAVVFESGAVGMNDRRGMTLAMDPVNANLKGLDGTGGTFLTAPTGSAYLQLAADGLRYGGQQFMQFMFSPSNIHNSGSGGTLVTLPPSFPLPCPSAAVDLRPSYVTIMRPNGGILVLSRQAWPVGEGCVRP